jgi:hypothetical protein
MRIQSEGEELHLPDWLARAAEWSAWRRGLVCDHEIQRNGFLAKTIRRAPPGTAAGASCGFSMMSTRIIGPGILFSVSLARVAYDHQSRIAMITARFRRFLFGVKRAGIGQVSRVANVAIPLDRDTNLLESIVM